MFLFREVFKTKEITVLHDWLRILAPFCHPIRSKIETNRDQLAHTFPRFASNALSFDWFTGLSVRFVISHRSKSILTSKVRNDEPLVLL